MKSIHFSFVQTVLLMVLCLSGFVFTSCEEEIYSEDPVYDMLFFSADSIDFQGKIHNTMSFHPGQTVYAGITLVSDGAYITKATQTWTLSGAHMEKPYSEQKTVVGPCGKEPTWKFTAPDSIGEYTVTFSEKYSYSASKANGTIYGQSKRMTARFSVK